MGDIVYLNTTPSEVNAQQNNFYAEKDAEMALLGFVPVLPATLDNSNLYPEEDYDALPQNQSVRQPSRNQLLHQIADANAKKCERIWQEASNPAISIIGIVVKINGKKIPLTWGNNQFLRQNYGKMVKEFHKLLFAELERAHAILMLKHGDEFVFQL